MQSEETIKQSILDLIDLNFQVLEEEDLEMYMSLVYMDVQTKFMNKHVI